MEKYMTIHRVKLDGVKIGGTYIEILGTNKMVEIVPKYVGPVPKQVWSVLKLSGFVFRVRVNL
jgi:hypothetical protein